MLAAMRRGWFVVLCVAMAGCYAMRRSAGGGRADASHARVVTASDVALPRGYTIEPIAQGLTFPTGVTVDEDDRVYVVESGYSYGEVFDVPRLLRVERNGATSVIATGENSPWTGVAYRDGTFYVAEGGELDGGRITAIDSTGRLRPLVSGLPSLGDHHTNGPAIGPDGWLYFSVGAATNSGVVGEDSAQFGWLRRHPDFHDTPCRDITLRGQNFSTRNPLGSGASARTGAYSPFGHSAEPGQVIRGQLPCNGAIMRVRRDGGKPELVAWGFRNPFGLAFAPDGRLYTTDNGYDVRGSRPVFGAEDLLWRVESGDWYGWPDYAGDRRLDDPRFKAPGEPQPELLLATEPGSPPEPSARFAVNSSADGFDFSRSDSFGYVGEAFVAQFGDMTPSTGKVMAPVGYNVVRVDPTTGVVHDFAVNRGAMNGPASLLRRGGLERPVAARFDRTGAALYVVDFGVMTLGTHGPEPQKGTGVLWRISRSGHAS